MRFLDRLLGRAPQPEPAIRPNTLRPPARAAAPDPDAVAVERYRYLLRTAPPDDLERAHAEAFERLTPEQRAWVREDLERAVPSGEAPASADPDELARAATRAEMRDPGTLERAFGRGQAAPGMGGSFLHTFAAVFLATSVADALFGGVGEPMATGAGSSSGNGGSEGEAWHADESSGDVGDLGGDLGDGGFGDFGGFDI